MKIRPKILLNGALFAALFSLSALLVHAYVVSNVELISVSTSGTGGDNFSYTSAISDDNRYALFYSYATDLVSGDTNGEGDIFLRDRTLGTTEKISQASDGSEIDLGAFYPQMSDNARYVVYDSIGTNIVAGDSNGTWDVFMYDRDTGTNTLLSRMSGAAGAQGPKSNHPSISDDGTYVVFDSDAPLEPADINGVGDIYMRNTDTNTTTLLSITSSGTFGDSDAAEPEIDGYGDYVVFESDATTFVSGDTNGTRDIFSKKTATGGGIGRISKTDTGAQTNGYSYGASISDGGRYIAYLSYATNITSDDTNGKVDVFLYDRTEGTTTLISRAGGTGVVGNGAAWYAQVSENGSRVVFSSDASNLVEDDTNGVADVFIYDIEMQTIHRVSTDEDGNQTTDSSYFVTISPDGTLVSFSSYSNDLVSEVTEGLNVYISEIAAEAYNLTVTGLSYDETADELTYIIENDGNADLLSGTDIYSEVTVTNPDGTETVLSNLDSDEDAGILERDTSTTFNLGVSLEVGASTIQVCVDSEEGLEEIDEADNCDTLEVIIAGDTPVEDDNPVVEDAPLADDADDLLTCENPFTDTVGHWAEKTICLLYLEGTVSGKSEGIFDPDGNITRAEILKMILLNSGETVPLSFEESPFSDVDEEDWFYGYVMYGFDLGVVEGYDDGTFHPNDPVNRAEALTMLLRMAGSAEETSTSGLGFGDLLMDDWFYDEVGLGIDYGLVEGYEDGTFRPGGLITRAEAATIIRRAWYVWYNN